MRNESDTNPRGAARELNIGLQRVYSLIWAGKLDATKRDGRWRISHKAIAERRARLKE